MRAHTRGNAGVHQAIEYRDAYSAMIGAVLPLACSSMRCHIFVFGLRMPSRCGAMTTSMGTPAAAIVFSMRVLALVTLGSPSTLVRPPWLVMMTTRCPDL